MLCIVYHVLIQNAIIRRRSAAAPNEIRGPAGRTAFFLLLSSSKDVSYHPCGAAGTLFFRLASRLAGAGAFFSLVGKEPKAPSRDVPSLENPLHYGGNCFLRFHCSLSGLKQATPMYWAKRLFEDVNGSPYRHTRWSSRGTSVRAFL